MPSYSVNIQHDCVESQWSGEQFGDWHEVYSNSFRSIAPGGSDLDSDLILVQGDPCYFVWAEYSSGDSFGHSTGSGVQPLALFTDKAEAEQFAKFIRGYRSDDYGVSEYRADSGQTVRFYASWLGYFESLDSVNVEDTVVSRSTESTKRF